MFEDAELVDRALGGDRWAEEAIYRRHAPAVTRLCTRVLRRNVDADDAVQETFVVAFEKLASLREPSALRPWLMRIAVHKSRRILRKRRLFGLWREQSLDAAQALIPAVHETRRLELRFELDAVEQTLAAEPLELRLAWVLHRVESLSLRETAQATGKSLATVKRYVAAVDARVARALGGSDV